MKLSLVLLLKPLTSVKENVTWFHLVQEFCPLKINITQFPDGFEWFEFLLISFQCLTYSKRLNGNMRNSMVNPFHY